MFIRKMSARVAKRNGKTSIQFFEFVRKIIVQIKNPFGK